VSRDYANCTVSCTDIRIKKVPGSNLLHGSWLNESSLNRLPKLTITCVRYTKELKFLSCVLLRIHYSLDHFKNVI